MTTVQLTFRHAPRLVLGLGVLLGIVGCGDLDDDEAASDEVTGAIANGRPGGGVGVVRLQLWNGRVLSNGKLDDVICTGTVISGDRILTAGHCVNKWLTIKDGNDSTVLLQGDLFAGAEYTTDGTNWFCLQDKTQAHCSPSVLAPVHVTRLGNGELPPDVAVIRFATLFQGIKSSHFRQLSIAEPRARQSVEVWGIGFTDPSGTGGGSTTNVMMRAVMRIASVSAKTVKIDNSRAQLCLGDSGGPLFAGPSDLIIGMVSQGLHRNGACDLVIDQTTGSRITPAAITLINNNRGSADPLCRETIPGTGFYACS